jgi:WD40 repeat protein
VFVTGSNNGELRVWDLVDYACQALLRLPKSGAVNAVNIVRGQGGDCVISGWEDGFIRCHDLASLNRQLWFIANAHRGGVTSLDYQLSDSSQYVISGGVDGAVRFDQPSQSDSLLIWSRVWKMSTRELVLQHNEHKKAIAKVKADLKTLSFVHSIGLDGTVLTFDLK